MKDLNPTKYFYFKISSFILRLILTSDSVKSHINKDEFIRLVNIFIENINSNNIDKIILYNNISLYKILYRDRLKI